MKPVRSFACAAALAAGCAAPLAAQVRSEPFKDVPNDHWAYQAVEDLRQKGIIIGYPDTDFRGKRTITRYEAAIALDRALGQAIKAAGPVGPQGPAGQQGPAGPQGPKGTPPPEAALFIQAMREMRDEAARLENELQSANKRIDGSESDLHATRSKAPPAR